MRQLLIITIGLFAAETAFAQEGNVMELGVQDCIGYAWENSTKTKESAIDVLQADKDVWIQAAKGLPQINGSVNFNNFIQIPTTVAPADAFGFPDYLTEFLGGVAVQTGVPLNPPSGDQNATTEFQFGQRYNMDVGLTASLQLFDGTYIFGVKAAKDFQRLTRKMEQLTKNEVETIIAESYYTSQVAAENVKLLSQNISNTQKTLDETGALYEAGFAEEMDVEQLDLLMNSFKNRLKMAERQHKASLNLLKYQMGMPIETEISLKDDLETLWALQSADELLTMDLDLDNNLAYSLADQNVRMYGYKVKLQEALYYPRLNAFFNYQQQAFRDEFTFFDFNEPWFPQTLWGLQLSVPIWDNLGAAAGIKKAKLEQQKRRNEVADLERALVMQTKTAKDNFTSSLEQLENSSENIGLATRIKEKTLVKYQEGLASSMELTTAENQLIQAQTDYIGALFQAMDAKLELKKVLENN